MESKKENKSKISSVTLMDSKGVAWVYPRAAHWAASGLILIMNDIFTLKYLFQ